MKNLTKKKRKEHTSHDIGIHFKDRVQITNYKQKVLTISICGGNRKWDSTLNILYNLVIDRMIQDSKPGRGYGFFLKKV